MPVGQEKAQQARIALQRFGLGPKPGGVVRIHQSPMDAILNEIENPTRVHITFDGLPNYGHACIAGQSGFRAAQDVLELEVRARFAKALQPEVGFVERLVRFWSNHFSMSVEKSGTVRATIGQLERDVIRRHVLGNFRNMLRGVMKHPAMISFLDNQDSIGPNSPVGSARQRGMNENLGRELLELHTVGVDAGYTKVDVENVSKIITGWSFVRGWEADGGWNEGTPQNRGRFIYRDDWHEPGTHTVMGVAYPPLGIQQGEMLLNDLALHPGTAEHIAFKLVHHFITDAPTPYMVEPVAEAFRSTNGNLKSVALALLNLPAAWNAPLKKVRLPEELTIAQMRAFRTTLPPKTEKWKWAEPLRALRHLPWECPSPAGYPDETGAWLSPDGMRVRSDVSQMFAHYNQSAVSVDATTLGRHLFDDAFSAESRAAVAAGQSQRQALTALLMSPEFQRR